VRKQFFFNYYYSGIYRLLASRQQYRVRILFNTEAIGGRVETEGIAILVARFFFVHEERIFKIGKNISCNFLG